MIRASSTGTSSLKRETASGVVLMIASSRSTQRLLWTHRVKRAEDRPFIRLQALGLMVGVLGGSKQLRQPKIEHLQFVLLGPDDIGRFQITMNNPGGMSSRQRIGQLSTVTTDRRDG